MTGILKLIRNDYESFKDIEKTHLAREVMEGKTRTSLMPKHSKADARNGSPRCDGF